MKYLLFLILLLPFRAFSQKGNDANDALQTTFRIDSLPVKSIILDKGWTWHPGDNPDWAKPAFDDTKWEPIDPTQDIDKLPQLKKAGIGWLRLRLKVDTSLVNQVVGILVDQVIASEIYLDGQRVAGFGKVSRNPEEVKAYNPSGGPLAPSQIAYFNLGKQTDQVLAVRFAVEPGLVYWGHVNIYTRCLQIRMNKANRMNYGHIESLAYLDLTPIEYFKAGLFLILALLHLTFYKGYRIQKANLYFGIYCLLIAGNFLLMQSTLQYIHSVSARMYVKQVTGSLSFAITLSLLVAIYALFAYPNKRPFRGLALLGLGLGFLCVFRKELGGLVGTLYGVLIYAESARVAVWAIRKKKENARYILFGTLGFAIFLLLFLLETSVLKHGFVRLITINLTYNLGALCLPVSIALYLAREFVQTSVSLQKNLEEVKQLSAEKEQILSTQNETLEQQVAERTAELSHKNEELVIEAALERIRSQSMAMQHSDDLQTVITVVSEQLQTLGFQFDVVNFVVDRADKGWDCYNAVPVNDNILNFTIPYFNHRLFTDTQEVHLQKLDFDTYTLTLAEKNEWFNHLFTNTVLKELPAERKQFIINLPGMAASVVVWPDITLSIINYQGIPYTDTQNAIFKRFGAVFGQAYTRFQDLKKAEAQAREAQIEAALERVRTQSMAMQHSEDLQTVITVVSEQLQTLGFQFDFVSFVVERADRGWDTYNAVLDNDEIVNYIIPYVDHKLFNQAEEATQQGLDFFTYTLTMEEKNDWLTYIFCQPIYKNAPEGYKQSLIDSPGMAGSVVGSLDIALSIVNYQGIPYTDTENGIFKRFGAVFGQAYTRFKDLKKAEEQARQAIQTASIDRVRAQIASMRTAQDLERITPLIWTELTTLQVPFFRCGVFIVNEAQHRIQAFLSTPDGRSRTQLNLAINESENNRQLMNSWQQQRVYRERWSHEQLQQWVASMVEVGQMDSVQEYEVVDEVKEAFSLQFIPFRQGMLYVGSQEPLSESELELAESLADAFSVAYARYEDFRQLEEAKVRVDAALTELKATQTQLIQKEKLASLGELTAGIAHEIQNPLNFVNNFSELSVELAKELKEERLKVKEDRDEELESELVDDLIQNQKKINHHGKRASSIVKGMLEHSRTSTGIKELTDINKLADEYLKLTYHGLRAKDKDFNADFTTEFDENLPKIEVIPQDMGRVLLNLINNAFWAVKTVEKPNVVVKTEQYGNQIIIKVSDNGIGMNEEVKAKIFQPFFTTKPTGEGTGLGLSLAYDIVTKGHGGTLELETSEGEGTTFIVKLPI